MSTDREKRIEAAAAVMPCASYRHDPERKAELAAALDAADRAVPVVSEAPAKAAVAAHEQTCHEAVLDATIAIDEAERAERRAEKAEAAARDFATALAFYADPDTYFAWAFLGDPPCGGWDSDFEKVPGYGSEKPGKLARDALAAHPDFAEPSKPSKPDEEEQ